MEFTEEMLKDIEAKLEAKMTTEMESLDSKSPEELLDFYNRKVMWVEMATSMEDLEQAERAVKRVKEAIIARMS